MTEHNINVDGSSSSTALSVVLSEMLSDEEDVKVSDEASDNSEDDEPEPEQPESQEPQESSDDESTLPREGSSDSETPLGISTRTREEPKDENLSESQTLRETLVFLEEKDISERSSFRPTNDNGDRVFPIKSSGQIDSIFISASDNTFKVYLELDGDKILDAVPWNQLDQESSELAHIGAYEKTGGEFIVTVSDYPFNSEIDFSITPTDITTFNTIRAEIMVDEYSKGEK